MMLANFENGENETAAKSYSIHTMPKKSENRGKLTVTKSLQNFDAKEMFLHLKNRSVSFPKLRKMLRS